MPIKLKAHAAAKDAAERCTDCTRGKREVRNSKTGEFHTVRCHCQFELPFPLILQPEKSGCALAAVAMVVQQPYATVRQYVTLERDYTGEGTYEREIYELLNHFGFSYQRKEKLVQRLGGTTAPWPPAPWAPLHVAMVRNLTDVAYHYVVMLQDGTIMDPWWGVVQGLHRYPSILSVSAVYPVVPPTPEAPTVPEALVTASTSVPPSESA